MCVIAGAFNDAKNKHFKRKIGEIKNFWKKHLNKKIFNTIILLAKDKQGEMLKMELSKNIFFNTDKLVENQVVKISYTGKFFSEGASEVYIHYGFGLLWENLGEIKMEKTDLGFQAEITLASADTLNFCFRNQDGEWDNNDNCNYTFPIEKLETEMASPELGLIIAPTRRLRKTYLWSKKVKLAIYKIITYIPKIISGNYKRRIKSGE